MSIVTSLTSNGARGNQPPGISGEPFSPATYVAAHTAEQSIGQTTEATLATINATLTAQEIARTASISGEYDSHLRAASPTSPKWTRDEPLSTSPIKVTHRWEGSVLHIYSDFFEARLTSLADESAGVTAEFDIEDLSDDDRSLLRLGASFYVTAILERRSGGRVRHSSDVRFRRLGRWHQDEIALMKERAKKRRAALGFEDETQ